MEARIAAFLVRYRWGLLGASFLALLVTVFGARDLWVESSYRIFFAPDDPYLQAYDHIEDEYTKADNVVFVVAPADGRIFKRETLTALRELTDESWQMPYSIRVDSITNFQHTEADGDDLLVNDLVPDPSDFSDEDIEALKQTALSEESLVGSLLSARAHVSTVSVRLELPEDEREAGSANQAIMGFARDLRADFVQRYPDLTIYLMGQVAVNHAFNELADNDARSLVPIMFIVVIVLIGVFLRSPAATLTAASVILFSILATVGLLGWLGFRVNQINVSAPVIILTLAVSDCVHILVLYLKDLRAGMDKRQAMGHTLEINLTPVFLTSLTTAIGFFSLNTSDSPPFRELGTVVGFGVFGAMLFTLTMVPALMMALPAGGGRNERFGQVNLTGLADHILRRPRTYALVALVAALVMVSFAPRNVLNDDTVEYFHKPLEIRQAIDFVQQNLTGVDSITYSLSAGESGGVNEPAYLRKVDAFKTWLETQDSVTHVSSFVDVVKRLNRNMHGDDPAYYRIPDDRELIAQYVLLYELSLPQGLDLNTSINFDKSATRLSVNLNNLPSSELIAFERKAADWLNDHAPDFAAHGSSVSIMFAHIGQNNIYSMLRGSGLAVLLIAITLIVFFRSFKFGLVSLMPNAFPAGIAYGVWAVIDGQVNLAAAAVFSITLGIVVDNTIHFLSKYLYARRRRGEDAAGAIRYAFSTVGSALLVTTFALAIGFLILAQSNFDVNATMGLMTAMVIGIALVFDLVFLPGLLMQFDRGRRSESSTTAAKAE